MSRSQHSGSNTGHGGLKGVGLQVGTNGPGTYAKEGGVERNFNRPRDRGGKHLAYQDLLDRRKRGLCFKCGGPFGPLH